MSALAEYLSTLAPGPVGDIDGLVRALALAWDGLSVEDPSMATHKLDRIESPVWAPPSLRFSIERHGVFVLGSIYADVQDWSINVETGSAQWEPGKSRQLGKRQAPFKAEPVAREVAEMIRAGTDDPRIEWTKNGEGVRISMSDVLPPAAKGTTEERRRRFYDALDAELGDFLRRGNTYKRTEGRR